MRAAASAPGKSTTYAVYIKHKAEHKTQNKHAEQTDKGGAQIKREAGRKGDRGKQPNATQSAAAVIDKFLALPCPVTQLEQGTGNRDRGSAGAWEGVREAFTIGSDWQAVNSADTFVRIVAHAARFKVNH